MGMRRVQVEDADDYQLAVENQHVLLTLKSAKTVVKIPILVSFELADQLDRTHIMWCRPGVRDDDKVDFNLLDR